MKAVNPVRCGKLLTGVFRNNWLEMPLTISLAVSGISVQAYASYMMVKGGNFSPAHIPLMNYWSSETS